jgi:hypothetical protein
MTLHKLAEFYTHWFSICPNISSTFQLSPYLEALSNKAVKYKCGEQLNINFNIQLLSTFVLFGFHKNGFVKSCSSLKGLLEYKISWSLIDWCKFCMHLISVNICYFGTIEVMGLK